jgi:hypothetical protein
MWKLGPDSGNNFGRPSTKTPLPQSLTSISFAGVFGGEPKMLVDGIAITASTNEETKNNLLAPYGDTNRIIQAHLDFLESLPPVTFATHDAEHYLH